jgi:hypothetical protein
MAPKRETLRVCPLCGFVAYKFAPCMVCDLFEKQQENE